MGTSLYDQYLKETGGPTKPAPLPPPPPIAAPDVTQVAPRPPAAPPSEPFIQKVARVNKAVRKALPLTGPLEQLEAGAKKVGEDQGKYLQSLDPGKMPRVQDYPDRDSYSKAMADYSRRYTMSFVSAAATMGLPEGAEVPKRPLANVPFEAYSRLEHAVDKAPFERGTAEQWQAALSQNVAKGEREYRGVDKLLAANKGKVLSKADINTHLQANPIKVGSSRYGDSQTPLGTNGIPVGWEIRPTYREIPNPVPGPGGPATVSQHVYEVVNPEGTVITYSHTEPEAINWARDAAKSRKSPRFRQYKEPGGNNYTENVLTLERNVDRLPEGFTVKEVPNSNDGFDHNGVRIADPTLDEDGRGQVDPDQYYGDNPHYQAWKEQQRRPAYAVHDAQGHQVTDDYETPEEAIKAGHIYNKFNGPKPFKQPGHFPDENPLAHYRYTDHVLPSGEKVRFLEEMQSDWHQAGRKFGYLRPEGQNYKVIPHPTMEGYFSIQGPNGKPLPSYNGPESPIVAYPTQAMAEGATKTLENYSNAVPDAPFKKTEEWTELALKDAIDQAKKDGIDRVAWTTGSQQAARYDLSKHVDRISYNPQTETLAAWKGREKIHEGKYDQRALPDVIGKEAAENLLSGDNQIGLEGETSYLLEGEGLKVGGSGMRAYYDKLVPKVVQEYAKKRGVKIDIEPLSLFGKSDGGYEGPTPQITWLHRRAHQLQMDDPEDPVALTLLDIANMADNRGRGVDVQSIIDHHLSNLADDIGPEAADHVAEEMGGKWLPPSEGVPNQSFSLKNLPEGPQPLWAAGAAGAGTAIALQQGGDDKNKGGDLYKQFQKEQQKEEPQSLYEQYKAEQEAAKPKPSIWDRLKSVNAGVRQALVPDALQQLETGAQKFGKDQGEWGVQLARDLKYVTDPARKAESGRPPTEEAKAVDRRILFALATIAMPAGVRKIFEDWVIARGIRPPALATEAAPAVSPRATTERPPWDRSSTAPPPVDQPQPLTPEQQVLRNRLATEGINPSGAIRRRPPTAPPPVEPGPEAQTFSTKGAVRRPAPAAPPVEAAAAPEAPPVERRAENPPDRVVWSPEDRARYISESQKAYAAKINKPWSQWTPEEKAGYFADQARVRAGAPWQEEVAAAKQIVGTEEFSRRSIAAAAQLPPEQKLEAIKQTAHEIVAGAETAHFPPEPKPGDITPVVSSNSEFAARPGVMRAVNKGEQPAALNSPLRLPEPTPEDRAIVQPKGVKEISPEEVVARKAAAKPEPVAEGHPVRQEMPQGATVDENGLFFEHRTPVGQLRDFRRVSTEGLIKAHREMQEQITRDQQLAIYRSVENENMSGTGDRTVFTASTRTARGTSQQAEAAERLRNYQKVMDRLDAELKNRGMSSGDVYNAIQSQEEHEAAIEQEAIHHADATDEADTAFGDFGDLEDEGAGSASRTNREGTKQEPPISDVLNVAKLNLGSKTAEQRMAAKLEEFRAQRNANKQTFSEADVNRAEILNELRAGDPIALPTEKAKKLSGEELLARRDLVRENDQIIQGLSKRLESAATPEEHQQAAELLQKAVAHNDALLSDLVTGSSQKGRDLNLLRRMAQQSLDPDVWRVQAKRMLGDRPLTAEVDAMIRKLLQEATDACG